MIEKSASKVGCVGSKKMGKGFINTGMGHRKMGKRSNIMEG
mgnify:CR=1 FL=1